MVDHSRDRVLDMRAVILFSRKLPATVVFHLTITARYDLEILLLLLWWSEVAYGLEATDFVQGSREGSRAAAPDLEASYCPA